MSSDKSEILKARQQVKDQFGDLFTEIEIILFEHDPIEIAFYDQVSAPENPDEYAPEVETILPRLSGATTQAEVLDIVYEEFLRWFDRETVGPKKSYALIATDIWHAWQAHKSTR